MKRILYKVAEHVFAVETNEDYDIEKYLTSFSPFVCHNSDKQPIFVLEICPEKPRRCANRVCGFEFDGAACLFCSDETACSFDIYHYATQSMFRMSSTRHFDRARLALRDMSDVSVFVLNSCLMMLFAFAASRYDTLLVHSSVVVHDGKGYMFLGKSGTGKSTHARLWMENIPGAYLLNDDNPVVRIMDGEARVYGSPWSGKTPCYVNESCPVGAIVQLCQAPHNRIVRFSGAKAYAALLSSCSILRQDEDVNSGINRSVIQVVLGVPVFHLECLPDSAAALLSFRTVTEYE